MKPPSIPDSSDRWKAWSAWRLVIASVLWFSSLASVAQTNPTVALSVATATVTENPGSSINIEIQISAAQPQGQVFGILLQGPGIIHEDFVNQPQNIEIAAGDSSGFVTVNINDDQLIEGTEQVTASINILPPNIDRAAQSEATFSIVDNDFATVTVSSAETIVNEGGTVQFMLQLDTGGKDLRKDLVLDLAFDNANVPIGAFGDANTPDIPGQDFRVFPNQLTFSTGAPDGDQRNVEVAASSDALIEGLESATIEIGSQSDTADPTLQIGHQVKIQDQNTPVVRFTTTDTNLTEGGSHETLGLQLDLGTNQLMIPLSFELVPQAGDSAIGNFPSNANVAQDYQLSPLGLSFTIGSPNNTVANTQIEALSDLLVEAEETANLTVIINTAGFPGFSPPATHRVRIQDTNTAKVAFETDQSQAAEGDASINLNAVLDTQGATLAVPLEFTVQSASIGAAVGRIGQGANVVTPDFELPQNTFEFFSGDADGTIKSLSITPIADALVEGDESATLELTSTGGPGTVGVQNRHLYQLADANPVTVNFSQSDIVLNEGLTDQAINLTIATGGAMLAIPIEVELQDNGNSTAMGDIQAPARPDQSALQANQADYTIQNPVALFPVGSVDQTIQSVRVSTVSDQLLEGEEIANLGFARVTSPATMGASSQFRLKIADQNSATISFQNSTSTVTEGVQNPHSIAVQLNTGGATLGQRFTTPFVITDQTAIVNSDYTSPNQLHIDWPELTTDGAIQHIMIPILDDSTIEGPETLEIELRTPSVPAGITANSTHTLTIQDSDSAMIGLRPIRDTASEDGDPVEVSIVLSHVSSTDTDVEVRLGGTAVPSGGTLARTIPAGQTQFDMLLFVVEDEIVEGPETLTLTLASITSGDPNIQIDPVNQEKSITIIDNDSSHITIQKLSDASEDQQSGEFKINLSKEVNQSLNLALKLTGTANGNVDYTTPALQLTIPARQTSLSIPITVIADNLDEPDETILASVAGNPLPNLPVTVQNGTTEMKIVDDDATPVGTPDLGASFTIPEDQTLNLNAASGVLANDTDADDGNGSPHLTAQLDGPTPASAQSFSLRPDGSFTYQPNAHFNGTDTFRYRASDGANQSQATLVTLTVSPVNDAPQHSTPGVQTVLDGGKLEFNTGNQNQITVDDPDLNATLLSVTLSASGTLNLGSTTGLNFTQGNGINNSSMAFTSTLPALNQALDGLSYTASAGAGPDTITLVTNDQGGTGDGGPQQTTSVISITVRPLNTPPQITLPEPEALAIVGSGSGLAVSPGLTIVDAEDVNLDSATVSITANYQADQDFLTLPPLPNGVTGSFDSNSGVLKLQGPAPLGTFQQLLRQVAFENTSATPQTDVRTVSFTVHDGTVPSTSENRDVVVSIPAFPPILSTRQSSVRRFVENGLPVSLLGNISISEGSAGALQSATASITSGFVTGEDVLRGGTAPGLTSQYDFNSGTLTIRGSASAATYAKAIGSVVYNNNSDSPSSNRRTVSFSVTDSERGSNTVSVNIEVESINDPPILDIALGPVLEFNQGDAPLSLFPTPTLSDRDDSQLAAATIMFDARFDGTADQLVAPSLPDGLTTSGFNTSNGSLTIEGHAPLSRYQTAIEGITYRNDTTFTQDRSLAVSVAVADPNGATSNTYTRRLSLVGASTPPEIRGLADLSVPEDSKLIPIDFTVRDDRTPSARITLKIEVTDQEKLFAKDGVEIARNGNGVSLTLIPLANISGVTKIQVEASDEQGLSTTASMELTITPVNDLPIVKASPLEPLIYRDGSGPRPLLDSVEIIDPDKVELIRATLRFTDGFQPHQDALLALPVPPIQAEFDPSKGELKLSGKALPKAYAQTIQSIAYRNISHQPTESLRTLSLVVNDTEETSSKPINLQIQVFDANLPPIGGQDRITFGEERSITIPFSQLLANDSDPDRDPVSISLVNRTTQGGIPIFTRPEGITIQNLPAGTTDQFYYTLTDRKGGYRAVRVTLTP